MASERKKQLNFFPDDLVFELLIRFPGKQIARCKCVCKSWRSIIKSAQFKDVYGTRQRGMILHWFQPVFNPASGLNMAHSPLRLNIFHSPVRELKDPEQEDFSWLCELGTCRKRFKMTQIVNGLLCVDHGTSGLTVYNVCTGEGMDIGERMNIPDPPSDYCKYGIHLGYDPASRMYKLLRWIWCDDQRMVQAHIMTLRPSGSSSTWRKVKCHDFALFGGDEMRISTSDGFVCWKDSPDITYMTLFDLNKEKFHNIVLPEEYWDSMPYEVGFVRAQYVELEHQQRLDVSLWSLDHAHNRRHFDNIECYVMEDEEVEEWSKHVLELPKEEITFAFANGNLCTSTSEMVLMNVEPGNEEVYCYSRDHTSKEVTRFQVGKLPERTFDFDAELHQTCGNYLARLSCLSDGNNLYLPLDDILGGRV